MSFIAWYLKGQSPRRLFRSEGQPGEELRRVRIHSYGPGNVIVRANTQGSKQKTLSLNKDQDLTLEISDIDLSCPEQQEAHGVLEISPQH